MSDIKKQLSGTSRNNRDAAMKKDIADIGKILDRLMKEEGLGKYNNFTLKKKLNRNGTYEIFISYDTAGARSPSFYRGYKGINDVILPRLLNTGFKTSNPIFGRWHDKWVRGLREREGNQLLERAVAEFNSMRKNGVSRAEYIRSKAY